MSAIQNTNTIPSKRPDPQGKQKNKRPKASRRPDTFKTLLNWMKTRRHGPCGAAQFIKAQDGLSVPGRGGAGGGNTENTNRCQVLDIMTKCQVNANWLVKNPSESWRTSERCSNI